MSFQDWATESGRRVRTEDTADALTGSLGALVDGARYRLEWHLRDAFGIPVVRTILAGESILHLADSSKELRRARTGIDEASVMEWLFEPADSETVVWDIGGYHGTYSVVAAAKGASVLAFEPHTENMDILEQHAALNGVEIDTYDVALSDTARSRPFGSAGSESKLHAGGDEIVETAPGDTLHPAPDIVKIDVEGHEAAVLRGLAGHLESVSRIVVEVHEGVSPAAIRAYLEDAGLTAVGLETTRSQTYIGGVRYGKD